MLSIFEMVKCMSFLIFVNIGSYPVFMMTYDFSIYCHVFDISLPINDLWCCFNYT
jgi:hypothetical protein